MKNKIIVISSNKINQSICDGLTLLGMDSFKIDPTEKKEFPIEEFRSSIGIIVVSTTDIEDDLEFYEHILYGDEIKNILFDEGDLKLNWDAQKWENHLNNKLTSFISEKDKSSEIIAEFVEINSIELDSSHSSVQEINISSEINSESNILEITPEFNIWEGVEPEKNVEIHLDGVTPSPMEHIEETYESPILEKAKDTPYIFQDENILEKEEEPSVGISWSTLDEINTEEQPSSIKTINQPDTYSENIQKENDFIELYPQEKEIKNVKIAAGILIPDNWILEGQKNEAEVKKDDDAFEKIQFTQSNVSEIIQEAEPVETSKTTENITETLISSPYDNQEDEIIHDDGAVLVLGGIGAPGGVASLLAHLDERLPVPVIIKIFLPQGHYDVFTNNMSKRTNIPVKLAESNETLEAGKIWILPPPLEALFEDGQWVALEAQEGESISAAGNTQSAIVILSGTSESSIFPLMEAFNMNCLILGSMIHESYEPTVIQKMISMGLIQDKFNNLGSHISERWGIVRELV